VKLLLVSNPTAQSGRNAKRIEQARRGLAKRGFTADFLATLPDGQTIEMVRDALDGGGYGVAVAMGGDGTFREVASAILESKARDEVALGMLPTGTANDQGTSFGLDAGARALERNLDVLIEGATTKLDAGCLSVLDDDGTIARKSWFFDSAGFGLSARILRHRNVHRAWIEQNLPVLGRVYRDQTVYAGATLKVFAQSLVVADLSARVVADGVVHELPHLTDLIVKNTRIYGGAWVLDPTSRHDDGLFEIVPLRGRSDWLQRAILDIEGNPLRGVVLRALRLPRVPPIRAARIEISFVTSGRLDAQIDGEETLATRRAAVEVVPRAIRLVVPRAMADSI
jgi:diacylglycerol kinase family enzyme